MNESRRPTYLDIVEAEFGEALGARPAAYSEKLTLFVAHRDRTGAPVQNVERWVDDARALLSTIGGGATSIPVRGSWLGPDGLIHEDTTLVYSYAAPSAIEGKVRELREFALRYAAEANQGEVGVLLENNDGDWFFSIPFEHGKTA